MQPKLLRSLETRSARPLGSEKEVAFDARIIAATNQDLDSAVEDGRFREDLLYRINVIQLELPPLRDRGNDILVLAQHFVEQFAKQMDKTVVGFTEPVSEKLVDYGWPGNVRELRNVMERSVALTRYERIVLDDMPKRIRIFKKTTLAINGDKPEDFLTLQALEQRCIEHVLKRTGNNKTPAARVLGVDRRTLYRKLGRADDTPKPNEMRERRT